jgi:Spy/CpxP family protein refolding chaperone
MKRRLITTLVLTAAMSLILKAQSPGAAGASPASPAAAANPARTQRLAAIRGRIAKALGLTTAQKEQIKTIRQQAKLTAQPVTTQLEQNQQALTAAIKAGDAAQVQALSKTQGELRGQVLAIRSQARMQIYAGLTNEQRTKLDAIEARLQTRIAAKRALAN